MAFRSLWYPMKPTPVSSKTTSRGSKSARIARTLHVYTSMLMLLIMLFFTLTGITLNHRDWFSDAEAAERTELGLPERFANPDDWMADPLDLGHQVRRWLASSHGIYGNQLSYEWEPDELLLVIDIKRPGGYSLVEVEVESGLILLEDQNYGAIAIFNDLHMGRYSGEFWSGFIDLSAVAMLLFTLTGLWLVFPQKKRRSKLLVLAGLGTAVMVVSYLAVIWL